MHNPATWIDPLGLAPCSELYARYKALRDKGLTPAEAHRTAKGAFADDAKLLSHFKKHGTEFGAKNPHEYLQVGRDIKQNGTQAQCLYKGETRTEYIQFMGNTSKGNAKFGLLGRMPMGSSPQSTLRAEIASGKC